MKALLSRTLESDKQTTGYFYLYDKEGTQIFRAVALELPDRDNETFVSRIPAGTYTVKKRFSKKYQHHYHIKDVPDRTLILIHPGNYYHNTKGCVLLGTKFRDINQDGERDVYISRPVVQRLLEKAGKGFQLTIVDL